MAEVSMKFLGPNINLTSEMFPREKVHEVMVLQQHCGGSTLCVFRELLPPNSEYHFTVYCQPSDQIFKCVTSEY